MTVGDPGGFGASPTVPPLKKAGGSGCVVWGLVGCGVFAVLCVVLIMIMAYSVYKNPEVTRAFNGITSIQSCSEKMMTTRAAIVAYRKDHHGAYPAALTALVPDYLKDKAALQCGGDGDGGAHTMEYTRPGPNASSDAVVVSIKTGSLSVVPTQKQTIYIRLLNNGWIVTDQEARTQLYAPDSSASKVDQ